MLLDGSVVMLFSLPVVCCLLGTCLGCVLVTGLMSDDLFLLVRTKYGLSLSYRNQGTYAVVHKYIPHHPHFVHAARHIDSMMDTDNSSSTTPRVEVDSVFVQQRNFGPSRTSGSSIIIDLKNARYSCYGAQGFIRFKYSSCCMLKRYRKRAVQQN